jgi:hypothetical protein
MCVSPESERVLVAGDHGNIAVCDLKARYWQRIAFMPAETVFLAAHWLNDSHCIAVIKRSSRLFPELLVIGPSSTSFDQCLLLELSAQHRYSREEPLLVSLDTCNGKMLVAATDTDHTGFRFTRLSVYAFDWRTPDFCALAEKLVLPFVPDGGKIVQMAQVSHPARQLLVLLDDLDTLYIASVQRMDGCSSIDGNVRKMESIAGFLVQDESIFAIRSDRKNVLVIMPQKDISLDMDEPLLGLYPNMLGCFAFSFHQSAFSPKNQLTALPLLPQLLGARTNGLAPCLPEAIPQTVLEYIILAHERDSELLVEVERAHLCHWHGAVAAYCRKVELSEASRLLAALKETTTTLIIESLLRQTGIPAALNFLPYLVRSYFENVPERREAVTLLLRAILKDHRQWPVVLSPMRALLEQVADLKELADAMVTENIEALCREGRLMRAYRLAQASGLQLSPTELVFDESFTAALAYDLLEFSVIDGDVSFWNLFIESLPSARERDICRRLLRMEGKEAVFVLETDGLSRK